MGILDKAIKRAKNFIKDTKKTIKSTKREIVKTFRRKYTGKKQAKNFLPGSMITFEYNAIDKNKRFDKKPLVISLGLAQDNTRHFVGLNIHWMPENQRVLLASLITEMLEKKGGKLDYKDVKPLIKKFEKSPIFRRYAIRRVSPKVVQMPSEIFLRAASLDFSDWSE